MTAAPPQVVQLSCPNCRSPMQAQVFTLVDGGRQPELKARLLSGQLNAGVCGNCGYPVMLAAPLVYHDAAKQLCLVHFPEQLNARPEEQERFIGEATGLLMRSIPPEAPRGYLLAPRRFLTLNSLVDTILEADGISREVIEAQRARVELISLFAEAYDSGEEALAAAVAEHRDKLDYEFFAALTAFAEASAQTGRAESTEMLVGLRDKLAELTGFDLEGEGGLGAGEEEIDLSEAIERLVSAPDEELEAAIGELRPVIDYSFYELLTARIDAAEQAGDTPEAGRLTARRALILETVERMDRQAQELFEAGAEVLRGVLEAPDAREALRAKADKLDEAFMLVLESNVVAAERGGRADIVERLLEIQQLASEVIEESLTPEERLINQLLQAETPQDATRTLRQNTHLITAAFVKRLNELADEMEQGGRKPLGERLRQLGREAGAMLF
jgi:hypothetical protein